MTPSSPVTENSPLLTDGGRANVKVTSPHVDPPVARIQVGSHVRMNSLKRASPLPGMGRACMLRRHVALDAIEAPVRRVS